jgi:hypothetical protein
MTQTVPIVYITDVLLAKTTRLLVSFAAEDDSEGVVYWFGLELGLKAIVTTLVVPATDTTGGRISTSPAANADAVRVTVDTPLVLLGQAHSHPSRNVDHSWVDDRDTFGQFPGAISVVVPHFARHGIDLAVCGVHRHLDGCFRRLRTRDLAAHLRVLPGSVDLRPECTSV